MKKRGVMFGIILIVILLGVFIFFSKFKEKEYNLSNEIKLSVKEKAKVENLNITLKSITDSTCKEDMVCFWQGEYSYELLINKEKVVLGTVTAREYTYDNYNITLSNDSTENYILFTVNKVE